MASVGEGDCHKDPNFAVICSFLDRYGDTLGLPAVTYSDLQNYLEDTTNDVSRVLIDIHVRLLRRIGKSTVTSERFEKSIIKFCHHFSEFDAWEVESYGYKHAQLSTKLRILKNLLECQFDYNLKFKEKINESSAEDMRFLPIGRDKDGQAYWYFLDNDLNLLVYKEEQDDEEADTWQLVCSNRHQLASLVNSLQQGSKVEIKEEEEKTSSGGSRSSKEGSPVKDGLCEDIVQIKLERLEMKQEMMTIMKEEVARRKEESSGQQVNGSLTETGGCKLEMKSQDVETERTTGESVSTDCQGDSEQSSKLGNRKVPSSHGEVSKGKKADLGEEVVENTAVGNVGGQSKGGSCGTLVEDPATSDVQKMTTETSVQHSSVKDHIDKSEADSSKSDAVKPGQSLDLSSQQEKSQDVTEESSLASKTNSEGDSSGKGSTAAGKSDDYAVTGAGNSKEEKLTTKTLEQCDGDVDEKKLIAKPVERSRVMEAESADEDVMDDDGEDESGEPLEEKSLSSTEPSQKVVNAERNSSSTIRPCEDTFTETSDTDGKSTTDTGKTASQVTGEKAHVDKESDAPGAKEPTENKSVDNLPMSDSPVRKENESDLSVHEKTESSSPASKETKPNSSANKEMGSDTPASKEMGSDTPASTEMGSEASASKETESDTPGTDTGSDVPASKETGSNTLANEEMGSNTSASEEMGVDTLVNKKTDPDLTACKEAGPATPSVELGKTEKDKSVENSEIVEEQSVIVEKLESQRKSPSPGTCGGDSKTVVSHQDQKISEPTQEKQLEAVCKEKADNLDKSADHGVGESKEAKMSADHKEEESKVAEKSADHKEEESKATVTSAHHKEGESKVSQKSAHHKEEESKVAEKSTDHKEEESKVAEKSADCNEGESKEAEKSADHKDGELKEVEKSADHKEEELKETNKTDVTSDHQDKADMADVTKEPVVSDNQHLDETKVQCDTRNVDQPIVQTQPEIPDGCETGDVSAVTSLQESTPKSSNDRDGETQDSAATSDTGSLATNIKHISAKDPPDKCDQPTDKDKEVSSLSDPPGKESCESVEKSQGDICNSTGQQDKKSISGDETLSTSADIGEKKAADSSCEGSKERLKEPSSDTVSSEECKKSRQLKPSTDISEEISPAVENSVDNKEIASSKYINSDLDKSESSVNNSGSTEDKGKNDKLAEVICNSEAEKNSCEEISVNTISSSVDGNILVKSGQEASSSQEQASEIIHCVKESKKDKEGEDGSRAKSNKMVNGHLEQEESHREVEETVVKGKSSEKKDGVKDVEGGSSTEKLSKPGEDSQTQGQNGLSPKEIKSETTGPVVNAGEDVKAAGEVKEDQVNHEITNSQTTESQRKLKRSAPEPGSDEPVDSEPNGKKARQATRLQKTRGGRNAAARGRAARMAGGDTESEDSETPLSQIRGRGRGARRGRGRRGGNRGRARAGNKPKPDVEEDGDDGASDQTNTKRAKKKKPDSSSEAISEEEVTPAKKGRNQSQPARKPKSAGKRGGRAGSKAAGKATAASTKAEEEAGVRRSARVKQQRARRPPTPSSPSEESSEESEEEETEEEGDRDRDFLDASFTPEEEDSGDEEFRPKGRNFQRQAARTIKGENEEFVNDDTPCVKCGKYNHPEMILLCDKCDAGYHTACLRPPLMLIPDGDWFCPPCEHAMLVTNLLECLQSFDCAMKKKDRLTKRQERLAYVGISISNILHGERKVLPSEKFDKSGRRKSEASLPEQAEEEDDEGEEEEEENEDVDDKDASVSTSSYESEPEPRRTYRSPRLALRQAQKRSRREKNKKNRSRRMRSPEVEVLAKRTCRTRNTVSYQFKEFDELISNAIEDDKPCRREKPLGISRGKDMSNILGASDEEDEKIRQRDGETAFPPPVVRKKSKRKLTMLDSDEEDPEEDESEEFKLSEEEDSEATEVEGEEEEEGDEEEVGSSDSGAWKPRKTWYNSRTSSRRQSRRMKDFVVEDEDYESDENATKRRSTRNSNRGRGRIHYDDWDSEETEEEASFTEDSSEDSDYSRKKSGKRRSSGSSSKTPVKAKARAKVKDENSDEQSQSDSSIARKRQTLRKLIKKRRKDESEDSKEGTPDREIKKKDLKKKKHAASDSDDSDFTLDEEEESGEESEESPRFKKKNVLRSSDEDEEEADASAAKTGEQEVKPEASKIEEATPTEKDAEVKEEDEPVKEKVVKPAGKGKKAAATQSKARAPRKGKNRGDEPSEESKVEAGAEDGAVPGKVRRVSGSDKETDVTVELPSLLSGSVPKVAAGSEGKKKQPARRQRAKSKEGQEETSRPPEKKVSTLPAGQGIQPQGEPASKPSKKKTVPNFLDVHSGTDSDEQKVDQHTESSAVSQPVSSASQQLAEVSSPQTSLPSQMGPGGPAGRSYPQGDPHANPRNFPPHGQLGHYQGQPYGMQPGSYPFQPGASGMPASQGHMGSPQHGGPPRPDMGPQANSGGGAGGPGHGIPGSQGHTGPSGTGPGFSAPMAHSGPGALMGPNMRPPHPGFVGGPANNTQHPYQPGRGQNSQTLEPGQIAPGMGQQHMAPPTGYQGMPPSRHIPPGAQSGQTPSGHMAPAMMQQQQQQPHRPPFHMGQQQHPHQNMASDSGSAPMGAGRGGYPPHMFGPGRMPSHPEMSSGPGGMRHPYYGMHPGGPHGMNQHFPGQFPPGQGPPPHSMSSPLTSMGQMAKNLGPGMGMQSPPHTPTSGTGEGLRERRPSMGSPPHPEAASWQEKSTEGNKDLKTEGKEGGTPDKPAAGGKKRAATSKSKKKSSETVSSPGGMSSPPPSSQAPNTPGNQGPRLPDPRQGMPPNMGNYRAAGPGYNPAMNTPPYHMPYMHGQPQPMPNMSSQHAPGTPGSFLPRGQVPPHVSPQHRSPSQDGSNPPPPHQEAGQGSQSEPQEHGPENTEGQPSRMPTMSPSGQRTYQSNSHGPQQSKAANMSPTSRRPSLTSGHQGPAGSTGETGQEAAHGHPNLHRPGHPGPGMPPTSQGPDMPGNPAGPTMPPYSRPPGPYYNAGMYYPPYNSQPGQPMPGNNTWPPNMPGYGPRFGPNIYPYGVNPESASQGSVSSPYTRQGSQDSTQAGGLPPTTQAMAGQAGGFPPTTQAMAGQAGGFPPTTQAMAGQAGGFPPTTQAMAGQAGGLPPTTQAMGGQAGGLPPTTQAIGGQASGLPPTTQAIGGQAGGLPPTTQAMGGQAGGLPPTTQAMTGSHEDQPASEPPGSSDKAGPVTSRRTSSTESGPNNSTDTDQGKGGQDQVKQDLTSTVPSGDGNQGSQEQSPSSVSQQGPTPQPSSTSSLPSTTTVSSKPSSSPVSSVSVSSHPAVSDTSQQPAISSPSTTTLQSSTEPPSSQQTSARPGQPHQSPPTTSQGPQGSWPGPGHNMGMQYPQQAMGQWPGMGGPGQYGMMRPYPGLNMMSHHQYSMRAGQSPMEAHGGPMPAHGGPMPAHGAPMPAHGGPMPAQMGERGFMHPGYPGYEGSFQPRHPGMGPAGRPGDYHNMGPRPGFSPEYPGAGPVRAHMQGSVEQHRNSEDNHNNEGAPPGNDEQVTEGSVAPKAKRAKTQKKAGKDGAASSRGKTAKGRGRGRGGFMIDNLLHSQPGLEGEEDGEDSSEMKDIVSYVTTDDYFKQQTSS